MLTNNHKDDESKQDGCGKSSKRGCGKTKLFCCTLSHLLKKLSCRKPRVFTFYMYILKNYAYTQNRIIQGFFILHRACLTHRACFRQAADRLSAKPNCKTALHCSLRSPLRAPLQGMYRRRHPAVRKAGQQTFEQMGFSPEFCADNPYKAQNGLTQKPLRRF